jgi:pyridoxamine 5'-phosphate oxidase
MAKRCFWLEFPEALCLSTIDSNGMPDSRMVLLRDFDTRGFTFFTNYHSHKGKQLLDTRSASMTFFWDALQRQVRIQGQVEICSSQESDAYFRSRSRGSQLAAIASQQSQPLGNRADLDLAVLDLSSKFKDIEVPRPENWGGFRLVPSKIEFWKARTHRLHDRFLYSRDKQGDWNITQLYP